MLVCATADPRDVQPELYGMGRHTIALLYAVPVLAAFDAIRNCSHCRRYTDDNCKAWREGGKPGSQEVGIGTDAGVATSC